MNDINIAVSQFLLKTTTIIETLGIWQHEDDNIDLLISLTKPLDLITSFLKRTNENWELANLSLPHAYLPVLINLELLKKNVRTICRKVEIFIYPRDFKISLIEFDTQYVLYKQKIRNENF